MSGLNLVIPYVDGAPLLAAIPRTIQCVCEAVARDHPDGNRTDAETDQPHVHAEAPEPEEPEPLLQIEGPKQLTSPDERYGNELEPEPLLQIEGPKQLTSPDERYGNEL